MTDDILREAAKDMNVKQLAADLGKVEGKETLSTSYIYQQLRGEKKIKNILDRCQVWLKHEKGDTILQWLCNENEGYFVKRLNGGDKTNHQVVAKLMKEFAEVISTIADALLDGKVSMREYKNLRKEWQDVQGIMEGFLDACERGEFS